MPEIACLSPDQHDEPETQSDRSDKGHARVGVFRVAPRALYRARCR
jgi:hypothetical protein